MTQNPFEPPVSVDEPAPRTEVLYECLDDLREHRRYRFFNRSSAGKTPGNFFCDLEGQVALSMVPLGAMPNNAIGYSLLAAVVSPLLILVSPFALNLQRSALMQISVVIIVGLIIVLVSVRKRTVRWSINGEPAFTLEMLGPLSTSRRTAIHSADKSLIGIWNQPWSSRRSPIWHCHDQAGNLILLARAELMSFERTIHRVENGIVSATPIATITTGIFKPTTLSFERDISDQELLLIFASLFYSLSPHRFLWDM